MRALNDIVAVEAFGPITGDQTKLKELLILRIAQIDRNLGETDSDRH
jgi:hypothetical protein